MFEEPSPLLAPPMPSTAFTVRYIVTVPTPVAGAVHVNDFMNESAGLVALITDECSIMLRPLAVSCATLVGRAENVPALTCAAPVPETAANWNPKRVFAVCLPTTCTVYTLPAVYFDTGTPPVESIRIIAVVVPEVPWQPLDAQLAVDAFAPVRLLVEPDAACPPEWLDNTVASVTAEREKSRNFFFIFFGFLV